MTTLDDIKRRLRDEDVRPDWAASGLPECSDRCPSHDGKRCERLGFKPDRICEPAALAIVDEVP